MKKVLSMLECDVKHCETILKLLRQDIMALQKMFQFKSEFEDVKMVEARNFVAPKIYELWIGLLDVCRTRYAEDAWIVELQEPREEELVEVEKEAKKPSNMDQLSAFLFIYLFFPKNSIVLQTRTNFEYMFFRYEA